MSRNGHSGRFAAGSLFSSGAVFSLAPPFFVPPLSVEPGPTVPGNFSSSCGWSVGPGCFGLSDPLCGSAGGGAALSRLLWSLMAVLNWPGSMGNLSDRSETRLARFRNSRARQVSMVGLAA